MTLEKVRDTATTSRPSAVALRRSAAIRVAAAVMVAGGVTAALIVAIWGPLNVSTDIVGYPTFADFNPYNYYYAYVLVAVLFPILAVLLFLGLTRIAPRLRLAVPGPLGRLRPVVPPTEADPPLQAEVIEDPRRLAAAAARVASVGVVLGLEVGIASSRLWMSVVLGALGYAVVIVLASLAFGALRSAPPSKERIATVNAFGAALTVAGLALVSAHTEVRIAVGNSTHHYAWFPVWLAVPLTAVLLGWIGLSLRRGGARSVAVIERRAVLLIAAPVALFLLVAALPGDQGQLNLFEQGQSVTETMLLGHGWLPWRDVVLTHGLLGDVVPTAVGWGVFGNSYWGATAGATMILHPLTFVATYFLLTYLVGRSWPLLLCSGLIFIGTWLAAVDSRYLLWPLILLLLAALLRRPTRVRAIGLGVLLVGQAIVTPEMAPAAPIVIVVLGAYEWYWRQSGPTLARAFSRTVWCVVGAVALAGAFTIYMASRGAMGDVIYVTVNLVTGHALDGALPPIAAASGVPQWRFDLIALAPVAALLISFAYAVVRLRLRRPFLLADWPMAALALVLLAYYSKFLARMDLGHAYQPFNIATPLLIYIVYRVAIAAEGPIRARLTKKPAAWATAHPVSLAAAIFVVVYFWGQLHTRIDLAPAVYRPTVAARPAVARVGYDASFDLPAYHDLRKIVDAYLGPRERIFDFTNEPALFYYFLDRDPSARWYAPNSIIDTASLQRNLIDELRRSPPKLIVFDDTDTRMLGLANFDQAPAAVHMYLVSRWILEHYHPLLESHNRTIYALGKVPSVTRLHLLLDQQPTTTGVPFLGQACTWGYSPSFLNQAAHPSAREQPVAARTSPFSDGDVTLDGWAGDLRTQSPAREVIVTYDGKVISRSIPEVQRPDVPAAGYPAGFLDSGFRLLIPKWAVASTKLAVFAIGPDGSAAQLRGLGAPPRTRRVRIGNRTFELQPGAVNGGVGVAPPTGPVLQVEPPAGSTWSDYRWLEVDAPKSGFLRGNFTLSDQFELADQGREIAFSTLPSSSQRYIVPISSCPQWSGYGSSPLFLTSSAPQAVAGVRLIR